MGAIYEVIIVGSGPAGLTAGLYTSRAGLSTLILEKETMGGELMNRDLIENYPGYPDGILGSQLGSNMVTQIMNCGVEIILDTVEKIDIREDYRVLETFQGNYWGSTMIIAPGSRSKKLGVPGEHEFADKGVFYCATCDGPRFSDKTVPVAGAGDSGITEALFLARLVSKVIVIELLPCISATKILQERAFSNSKIEIKYGTKIEAIYGNEQVEAVEILDVQTEEKSLLKVDGVLIHVGIEPNTDFLGGNVPLNEKGQILVNERMETEIPGIFAAGDVRHNSPCQISTAVGDGPTAALSVIRYWGGL